MREQVSLSFKTTFCKSASCFFVFSEKNTMAAPGDDGPRSPDGEPPTPEWDAVKERPWDMDAWVALIQPLEKAGAILGSSYAARDELRRAYEGILQV